MHPSRGANLRMLVQRQWANPSAVEMTLFDVSRLWIDVFGDLIFGVGAFQGGKHPGMEIAEGT